jgi:hypothetical protein
MDALEVLHIDNDSDLNKLLAELTWSYRDCRLLIVEDISAICKVRREGKMPSPHDYMQRITYTLALLYSTVYQQQGKLRVVVSDDITAELLTSESNNNGLWRLFQRTFQEYVALEKVDVSDALDVSLAPVHYRMQACIGSFPSIQWLLHCKKKASHNHVHSQLLQTASGEKNQPLQAQHTDVVTVHYQFRPRASLPDYQQQPQQPPQEGEQGLYLYVSDIS